MKIKCNCCICGKKILIKKSQYERRNKNGNITCSRSCLSLKRKDIYSGRLNPNCKFKSLNDAFFENIDSVSKAYVLGWIASDGSISRGSITIEIKNTDKEILYKLKDIVCPEINVQLRKTQNGNRAFIRFNSITMVNDVCRILSLQHGKKDSRTSLPTFDEDIFKWAYIHGHFDGDGCIRNIDKRKYLDCKITTISSILKKELKIFCEKCGVKGTVNKEAIEFYAEDAMRFLNLMYGSINIHLKRKHNMYLRWKTKYEKTIDLSVSGC